MLYAIIAFMLMMIIPIISTVRLNSTYKNSLKITNSSGLTGFEVAKKILANNGLDDLYIIETPGTMTDAYDSSRKVLRLSHDVFNGTSIAATAIAAHECGHAIQDKDGYGWFKIRKLIGPVVRIGEQLSYIILIVGLILGFLDLIYLGVALMLFGLIFELVTLPVELDASKRALALLPSYGLIDVSEEGDTKKMLKAAAFTYIAAILTTISEMLYYYFRYSDRR